MNILRESLENYVSKVLGIGIKLKKWPIATSLPRFLYDAYDFYFLDFLDVPHLFLIAKSNDESTPATIKKEVALVSQKFSGEIVVVYPRISQHNRSRLIEYKISFIVPDNQLYLPGSGMALREYFRQGHLKKTLFSPSAQVVVLHAIIGNQYGPITATQLVPALQYSAMTLTRAFDEITASEVGTIEHKGRERILSFVDTGRALWEKTASFLSSPVKKVVWLHLRQDVFTYPKAGLSALAQQSMISEPDHEVYALSVEQFKNIESHIDIVPHPEPGAICIEVWRYAPDGLGSNGLVDPLSLYLSLKECKDERVAAEAQTMMEAYFGTGN